MKIVYEDNHLLIVVKPPNLLTQADKTGDEDLFSQAKEYIRVTYHKPGEVYLGLVHRMDRPVGGLLAFAKTSKAAERLSRQVATHEMGRTYLAIVRGEVSESDTLHHYLLKDEASNTVQSVPFGTPGSKEAVLHYRRIAMKDGFSLVEISLETGRSHQIRVQFATSGHSLFGDARYGNGPIGVQIALWGAKLRLTHPTLKTPAVYRSTPEGSTWQLFRKEIDDYMQLEEETI